MPAPHALSREAELDVYAAHLRRVPFVELAERYRVTRDTISRIVDRIAAEMAEAKRPELEDLRVQLFAELDTVKGEAWAAYRQSRAGSMARNGALSLVKDCITEQAKLMGLEKLQIDHRHVLAAKVEAWMASEVAAPWLEAGESNGNTAGEV